MIDLNQVADVTSEKGKRTSPLADSALRHVETAAQEVAKTAGAFGNRLAFRGLLKDVRGKKNGELFQTAGMDWDALALPVMRGMVPLETLAENDSLMQAEWPTVKTRPATIPKVYALTRSDNGGHLAIVSDKFQVHQTREIFAGLQELADAGDAEILFAGCVDEGRKVVAIARIEGEFELPDASQQNKKTNDHSGNVAEATGGDKTQCLVVLSGGHEQGTPCRIRGMAWRLWCLNGVYFLAKAKTSYSRSHQGKIGANEMTAIKKTYEGIRAEFSKYGEEAKRLQETEADKDQQRLFVAELIAPGITVEVGKALATGKGGEIWSDTAAFRAEIFKRVQERAGKLALNQVIKAHEESAGFAVLGKQMVRAIEEQDGANGSNLWTAYNGITWFVDHKRGRTAESGVDASLFGAGARLKERALVTANGFVAAN